MSREAVLKKTSQLEIITIAVVLLSMVMSLAALWRTGINARRFKEGPPLATVLLRERDAFDVWRGYGAAAALPFRTARSTAIIIFMPRLGPTLLGRYIR